MSSECQGNVVTSPISQSWLTAAILLAPGLRVSSPWSVLMSEPGPHGPCIGILISFSPGSLQIMVFFFITCSNFALRDCGPLHTMSQELRPRNGEDPWLSSKGLTVGVGKAVICSHGPSSIVWSVNWPCCGTIAYFVGGKRGEDLASYNMSQTLSIWENYLMVFVCHGIYLGFFPAICLVGKILKNSWSSEICVWPTSWRRVFFEPLGLHLRVWSELGWSPPFWPMRALRLLWSHASNLCGKWPCVSECS